MLDPEVEMGAAKKRNIVWVLSVTYFFSYIVFIIEEWQHVDNQIDTSRIINMLVHKFEQCHCS